MVSDRAHAASVGTTSLDPRRNQNLVPVGLVGPLKPGQEVVDAIGRHWRPKLNAAGKAVIRPTRPGDRFLANSRNVRIVACTGRQFKGLTRQIVEPATQTKEGAGSASSNRKEVPA